ncbi:cytochrome c maturation protein CcmE [Fuscovulum blasticum]|uniref:cytochrome c maturation protein CcmE n=1 Tax=Fuscovulum blasticum TaxID=1075 RepID=UPI000D3EB054|nr:cytochrome c maturation protein CcmE [Fuscovulum blasticum]AWD20444.1 cytochrome c biogenesis protein CcmE [Fuscovulum blasticum]
MNGTKQEFRGLKGLKKQRRIQVILLAFLAMAVATGLIGYAMRDGINFFRSPTQVAEEQPGESEVFRLGGLVKQGSRTPPEGMQFGFVVTDTKTDVPVRYVGNSPPPDLFTEGQGTIVTGTMKDGVFLATEIMAKHDETYQPKEVVKALKEQGVDIDPSVMHGGS